MIEHKHIEPNAAMYTHAEMERIIGRQAARIAELEAELAARPAPLEWTSEPPKVEGGYWVLLPGMETPQVIHLTSFSLNISSWWWDNSRFAGPIPEPSEPGTTGTIGTDQH